MMRISIPSRSRPDKIRDTVLRFPPEMHTKLHVFAPVSQHPQYARNLQGLNVNLREVPDEFWMSQVLDLIGKTAVSEGCDKFLIVDDDVKFEVRRDETTTRTTGCTIQQTRECLQAIEAKLDNGRWGMVGLQARQFQNANPPGSPETMVKECTRTMCVTGWRADDFKTIDYTRCVVKTDFDATLQLLRKGRPNINLCYWQHSQVNNSAGGCSDYRTTEIINNGARRLAELHPGLVSVVEKEYPAQMRREKNNLGKRLEVMVQWKKALGWDLRR